MSHNAVDGRPVSSIVPLSCQVAADALPDRLHRHPLLEPKAKTRPLLAGVV